MTLDRCLLSIFYSRGTPYESRPESGRDCLMCAIFARPRLLRNGAYDLVQNDSEQVPSLFKKVASLYQQGILCVHTSPLFA